MSCKTSCSLCKHLIISTAVTVVTIDDTDTLVIDLPAGTYANGEKYCIVIAQAIPATATINMPVAFSIGGVTTTVYPFTRCDCAQATACAIRTRTRYSTRVITTATGGTFRSLGGLSCAPNNALASLPVATTTTTPATVSAQNAVARTIAAKTTAGTTKTKTAENVNISANSVTVNQEGK